MHKLLPYSLQTETRAKRLGVRYDSTALSSNLAPRFFAHYDDHLHNRTGDASVAEEAKRYTIRATQARPHLDGVWDSDIWSKADTAKIDWFHPLSSKHRPDAQARALFSAEGLHIIFRIKDQYVRSVTTEYCGPVWKDACAEFFVQPRADKGYFNLEMNCGGTFLLGYAEMQPDGKKKSERVPWDLASRIEIFHSMPEKVDPEIAEPTEWRVEYFVPFAVFEKFVGPLGNVAGQTWRGNFYKCAENNSHPHWGAWSPVGTKLDFHQPDKFGEIVFEG